MDIYKIICSLEPTRHSNLRQQSRETVLKKKKTRQVPLKYIYNYRYGADKLPLMKDEIC